MKVAAVFDFDKTLTYCDTLWPFIVYTHGLSTSLRKVLPEIPFFYRYWRKKISRQEIKERLLTRFFKDVPLEVLLQKGKEFARSRLKSYLRPEAIRKLHWHKTQGHQCIIVSAAIGVYIQPWALSMGFDSVITSELETNGFGTLTGRLNGLNCWGPEKTRRLMAVLGNKSDYSIYAYGDSRGDSELLACADFPFYRKFK